jgi:Domain of unknown function (DUF6321)/Cytidylyltransferase-like
MKPYDNIPSPDSQPMHVLVVYSGRFQPFHLGHKAVYDQLVAEYGHDVYIATSTKTEPERSPFSFADKLAMIKATGIAGDKVIQVKNPYKPDEITAGYDAHHTILLFAVGAKDMQTDPRFNFGKKKDGQPSYLQKFKDLEHVEPMNKHAYVVASPTVEFEIGGKTVTSATAIRAQYQAAKPAARVKLLAELYGRAGAGLRKIFDRALGRSLAESQTPSADLHATRMRNNYIINKLTVKESSEMIKESIYHPGEHRGVIPLRSETAIVNGQEVLRVTGIDAHGMLVNYIQHKDVIGESKNRDPNWKTVAAKRSSGAAGAHRDKRADAKAGKVKHKKDDAERVAAGLKESLRDSIRHDNPGIALAEIKKGEKDERGYTKCWPGYHAAGTKKSKVSGKRVRNCVPNESITEDLQLDAEFDIIEEMIEDFAEFHGVDPDVIWEDMELVSDEELLTEAEAWQTKKGKNKNGGLNKKGVASYRRSHPGSKLQTAVTTKPSKLKKGSKAAKRRKSFCARMRGMKKHRTSAKTARDPNSRINKSLRKWHCESFIMENNNHDRSHLGPFDCGGADAWYGRRYNPHKWVDQPDGTRKMVKLTDPKEIAAYKAGYEAEGGQGKDYGESIKETFKNEFSKGDRVETPMGPGTIVAVSKNISKDGRVKVKLDDPARAGKEGEYQDTFVLTTTNIKHVAEQEIPEGWKSAAAAAAMMGSLALSGGAAKADDMNKTGAVKAPVQTAQSMGQVDGSSYPTNAPVGTKFGSFKDASGRLINKYVDKDLTTRFKPDDEGEWDPQSYPTNAPVGTKFGSFTDKDGVKWDKYVGADLTTNFKRATNESEEVWDKPNPVKKHKALSAKDKAAAKARASRAGRKYPNMVDNIWAARR